MPRIVITGLALAPCLSEDGTASLLRIDIESAYCSRRGTLEIKQKVTAAAAKKENDLLFLMTFSSACKRWLTKRQCHTSS